MLYFLIEIKKQNVPLLSHLFHISPEQVSEHTVLKRMYMNQGHEICL